MCDACLPILEALLQKYRTQELTPEELKELGKRIRHCPGLGEAMQQVVHADLSKEELDKSAADARAKIQCLPLRKVPCLTIFKLPKKPG